jgi:glycosyltransferase involved in cell wall biosynthesis
MKPKVALFCVLDNLSTSYSLTEVLLDQAKMLARSGHRVDIWLEQQWTLGSDPVAQELTGHPLIRCVNCIPRVRLYDYRLGEDVEEAAEPGDPIPCFDRKVMTLVSGLSSPALGVDLIITHDLLFQSWYLAHGWACHDLARLRPHLKWLHWQHSASAPPPDPLPGRPHVIRWQPMENSRFVFVNDHPQERAITAAARGIPERQLAYVPNTRDPLEYLTTDPDTRVLVREYGLLEAELLVVVPARLCEGKQPDRVLRVLAAFRRAGVDARAVWCAAYPPGDELVAGLRRLAGELHLPEEAFVITSEVNAAWRVVTPRSVVRDLQLLADLLVLPSLSEAHSLVAMEAALCRQILVLNDDFPAMAGWFPTGSVYSWHFSSNRMTTQYHGPAEDERERELAYYTQKATALLYDLQFNPAWRAFSFVKRKRNLDAVRREYLDPLIASLFQEDPAGETHA